jgi:hypothetical protein
MTNTSPVAFATPALGPKIVYVVHVNVRQEVRSPPLPRPLFTDRDDPVFQHARLQPLPDHAVDTWITDPMLDETHKPTFTDFVEKGSNVRDKK